MIFVWFSLLLSLIQYSIAPNALVGGIENGLSSMIAIPKQNKVAYDNSKYIPVPELKTGAVSYSAPAKAALIYDVTSGKLMYAKSENDQLPMASLTKLMTAMVIMQNHSPSETVTIPSGLPELGPLDEKIGIEAKEQFRLSDLMQALLIYSANDVANALAVWDAGSVNAFTAKMNDYASQWKLTNTHYTNATGLDSLNHYSSASDLGVLSNVLLHDEKFRTIINTPSATIHDQAGKPYKFNTTNKDLALPYVYGIKTGLTDDAGQCLILLAQRNGHEIMTVVLNSPDRFQESKNMVEYAFNNYIWK